MECGRQRLIKWRCSAHPPTPPLTSTSLSMGKILGQVSTLSSLLPSSSSFLIYFQVSRIPQERTTARPSTFGQLTCRQLAFMSVSLRPLPPSSTSPPPTYFSRHHILSVYFSFMMIRYRWNASRFDHRFILSLRHSKRQPRHEQPLLVPPPFSPLLSSSLLLSYLLSSLSNVTIGMLLRMWQFKMVKHLWAFPSTWPLITSLLINLPTLPLLLFKEEVTISLSISLSSLFHPSPLPSPLSVLN